MVQWDQSAQIIGVPALLSPVLGGSVVPPTASIKRHPCVQRTGRTTANREIKKERIAHRRRHRDWRSTGSPRSTDRLPPAPWRATPANRKDFDPDELESDYYPRATQESAQDIVGRRWALQNWVPLVAAAGSMIIVTMLLFKGFKAHAGPPMNNYFIIAMVGAAVRMATFISPRHFGANHFHGQRF